MYHQNRDGRPPAGARVQGPSSSSAINSTTMTALSLASLGSQPEDIIMHVDWETRTTTITLSYHHGRVPQNLVGSSAHPTTNVVPASAGAVPPVPQNGTIVSNDNAAYRTIGRRQAPNQSASPCARGCNERPIHPSPPASRPPSSSRKDRVPVPQLELPEPDRRLHGLGLSGSGTISPPPLDLDATTSPNATATPNATGTSIMTTTPSASTILALPCRNRFSGPAALPALTSVTPRPPATAASPTASPASLIQNGPATPTIPRSAAPSASPHVASPRPAMPIPSGSSSGQVKAEKRPAKKDKKAPTDGETSEDRPVLARKHLTCVASGQVVLL
ncbi:hypothetical protein BN946_scf184857.g15 [Trametes cinnabarina]|uniref:Uncharacterized protein n=1 Tax=Pycnoporus cinnabarinus TaxID=5643 RepID=A0A060SY00_PYCCI|nr:hypothetical protein BN946_scf184857.g15 [Trametes cinnabarina]